MRDDMVAFVHALAEEVPKLRRPLRRHVAYYEETLPHLFMGDVSRFAVGRFRKCAAGSADACAFLAALLGALEHGMAEGPEIVQELISVSFLENLADEMAASSRFRALLGPALRKELQVIIDFFGYPVEP